MPLTESVPDALARVYAQSLFDLATEAGGQQATESTLAELEDLLEIARADPQFSEFLSSRILSKDRRRDALRTILKGRCSDLTMRFLLVLNDKGRLAQLPSITAAFDQLAQKSFGRVEVDVYTASPIDPAELNAIRERLDSVLGKQAIVHPYTDNSMIGGLKLQIGDQLIDASLATRLRRMRDNLATGGLAALRAKAERILGDPSNN